MIRPPLQPRVPHTYSLQAKKYQFPTTPCSSSTTVTQVPSHGALQDQSEHPFCFLSPPFTLAFIVVKHIWRNVYHLGHFKCITSRHWAFTLLCGHPPRTSTIHFINFSWRLRLCPFDSTSRSPLSTSLTTTVLLPISLRIWLLRCLSP